jgi:hypothetical protein
MAQQNILTVDRTGSVNPIASGVQCASGGDSFPNTGSQVVFWNNAGTTSVTVTEVIQQTVDGQPVAGRTFVVSGELAAPAAPTLGSTAGGTDAAETKYCKVTYTNGNGESLPSAEANLACSADTLLTVASPAASLGATGYNVYVSTATGTETKQNATPIPIGTNWTEPTSGLIAGAALPTVNTTAGQQMSGPYPTNIYNDTNQNMNFTYSANPPTGLKMTVLQNTTN